MSSIDSVTGINNTEYNDYSTIIGSNGASEKDAGFSDILTDAITTTREDANIGVEGESNGQNTKSEYPAIPGFPGGYTYHQYIVDAQTDITNETNEPDAVTMTGDDAVHDTNTLNTDDGAKEKLTRAGEEAINSGYLPESDDPKGYEAIGEEYPDAYDEILTPGYYQSFEYYDTYPAYNTPGSNIDFSGMISDALRDELTRMGAAAAAGYAGMPDGQMPFMQNTGIEQMILTAASTGQVDDAQIALFMLCMMMQTNQDNDFSMLMQMMVTMLTQMQGDTGALRNNVMSSGYDPSVLGTIDRNVFNSGLPGRYGTGQALLPVDGWVPTTPAIVSTEGYRDPQLYSAVVSQFRVEMAGRYQPRDGKTYCNIFVWDVTSAMGAEIPYRTDSVTGEPWPDDRSNAISMSAARMDAWLETFGSSYGWREVDARTAQMYANQGRPAVTTAGSIGHVQMVVPSRDGRFDEERGVTIAQAGGPLTSYRYITSTYSSSALRDHVRYWVHA